MRTEEPTAWALQGPSQPANARAVTGEDARASFDNVSGVPSDPVLMAIVRAAVNATGATVGWLAALDDDALRVVAAAGTDAPVDLVDARVAAGGAARSCSRPANPWRSSRGVTTPSSRKVSRPRSESCPHRCCVCRAVTIRCWAALELIDKDGGGSFSFDDIEIATLLAGIAGAALSSDATRCGALRRPESWRANSK